jgi:adenosylcobinamide kinase/adenosylcobinamide-phosphate guanylyltransferase
MSAPTSPARTAATTTLVTGPVRSGKSRHAEELLRGCADVTYVATGLRADAADADPEWARRVASHQARRPDTWRTVETVDLEGVIRAADGPLLIDCLGTWLTGVVDEVGWDDLRKAESVVASRGASLVESLCATTVPVVVVTNEVGWSLVPTTPSGRFFLDDLGRLNAAVSAVAAHVHLVVAGRVLDLSAAPTVAARVPTAHPSGDG